MPIVPAALLATVNAGSLVPFAGAGVSMVAPTRLPSAAGLAEALVDRGYGEDGDDLEAVADRCWQVGGAQHFARALQSDEWRTRSTNAFHTLLAELASEGLIQSVLTTNWDTMFEAALREYGVRWIRIARPEDMAVAPHGAVQVVNLMGCIDLPETLRAQSVDVDSEEWADAWAASALETTFRTRSILFAGYSGASRAATKTIERIAAEHARETPDWFVDRLTRKEAEERAPTKELLEALALRPDGYIKADAAEFAAAVRTGIYPLLLGRAATYAKDLLINLLEPLEVKFSDVRPFLRAHVDLWKTCGREAAQLLLRDATQVEHQSGYVPIAPNAAALGRLWAWLSLATWANVIESSGDRLEFTLSNRTTSIRILPVICAGLERRDQATALALGAIAQTPPIPRLGVVVGGFGPPSAITSQYSVARGGSPGNVARPGPVKVEWVLIDDLFMQVQRGMSDADLRTAMEVQIADLVNGFDE